MHSAVMNVCTHVLVWVHVFSSLGHRLENGIAGSYGNCRFTFWETAQLFSFLTAEPSLSCFILFVMWPRCFYFPQIPPDTPFHPTWVSGNSLRQKSGIRTCVLKLTLGSLGPTLHPDPESAQLPNVCSGLDLKLEIPKFWKRMIFLSPGS